MMPPNLRYRGRQESCSQAPAPKISTRNLAVWYGSFQALKGICLDIPAGRVAALVGPSGCGKSTFLRTINRMNEDIPGLRVAGQVWLDEEAIYSPGVDVVTLRRRVGMIFQRPNPFPKSIFDNIAYGPRLHGVHSRGHLSETVERCLRWAALWDEVRDRLHQSALSLSGGQQQRLCLARALAVEPEVLLMDEPTAALDPVATERLEDRIIRLKERYTIVIVTHNLQQAARISDRTAFFLGGELIEAGDTAVIFRAPRDPRTGRYLTGGVG